MNKKLIGATLIVSFLLPAAMSIAPNQPILAVAPTATPASDISRAIELNHQGENLYNAGQYADAIAAFEQALTIMQRLGYRSNEGILLSNIGAAYEAEGQFVKALDLDNQALVIAQQTGNTLGQAQTLTNIGNIYVEQGQYSKALTNFTQSLAMMNRLGDRASQGQILNSFGNVYRSQGKLTKALDAYNQALSIAHQLGDSRGEGLVLSNIGSVDQTLGQYGVALNMYNHALVLSHQSGDRASEARTFAGIGNLYIAQGEYDRGINALTQALAINQELGSQADEADTLNNIGNAYSEQNEYDQALSFYKQALTVYKTTVSTVGEATTIYNIGLVYKRQEKYSEALDSLNQALAMSRQLGDPIGEANCLATIGGLYSDQGENAKGLDFLKQSLAIQQTSGGREALVNTLSNIGIAYEGLGRVDDAIASYRSSSTTFEALLKQAGVESSASSLLSSPSNVFAYHRLAFLLAQNGRLEEAINYTERGHAVLTRAELLAKPIDVRTKADQASLQREADLRSVLNSAQMTLDSLRKDVSASAQDIQSAQTALDKAQQDYQTYIESLQLQDGFATLQFSGKVATLSEIQAAIPADTTLILYSIDDGDSVVFLITPESVDAVTLDFPLAKLEETVKTFISDRRANVSALSTLYEIILKPVSDKLKTKHLMIAPDGILNYLPFAALRSPNGHDLIDDYAVSLIPSATTLVMLRDRKPQQKATSPGLVLAQPSAPDLPRLENARTEAANIAKLLGIKPILDASETDLRQHATGAKILTISAHVELDLRQPLFGTIYLKSVSANNSRFDVRNVYELDLTRGTDLVVLSGCSTAIGGTGEDFGVLTRAFFAAGSPRVVASLWSVDDESTAFLMSSYITERSKGAGDDVALRTAMMATRNKYPEPYYWASFVLNGLP